MAPGQWALQGRKLTRSAGSGTAICMPQPTQGKRDSGGEDGFMTCTMHVAWDERLIHYDFGPGHPLAPVRVELTVALARAFGVLDAAGVTVAAPEPATTAELELVHDPRYISVVQQASAGQAGGAGYAGLDARTLFQHGLGTEDDPVFPGMHDAAALVAGATLARCTTPM